MEAIECIKTRRSIRKFKENPVDHTTIEKIVEAAGMSPSWKNTQIVRYHVVEDRAILNEIANLCVLNFEFNTKTISRAPQLVVVSMVEKRCGYERDGSYSTSKEDRWEMFDAGIATQTFCLAAHDLGLGTVIMGVFDRKRLQAYLEIPQDQELMALIAVGHPAEVGPAHKRKDVDVLLSWR